MKQNKKSILGLNTVKAFIVVLLSLAIIGIITLVVLGSLNSDQMKQASGQRLSVGVTNESLANVQTNVATDLAYATWTTNPDLSGVTCTVTNAYNATGVATYIRTANYTMGGAGGCTLTGAAAMSPNINNSAWKITYLVTYIDGRPIAGIANNVSGGISAFFGNAGTFFALLGVVVIILIISLVVVVVNRFGGEGGTSESPGTYATT